VFLVAAQALTSLIAALFFGADVTRRSGCMNDKADSTRLVTESLAERVARPVVYRLPDMDRVRVISNLQYGEVDNPYLLMDVYIPPDLKPHERRPVVVFIHGGLGPEHKPKDWGMFQSWGRLVAAAGMVAVMFTHRFSPPPQLLLVEAASDLRAALQYLRSNAESFQADGDCVGVCAWSSGGELLTPLLSRERPVFVRCLVAFYALLDVQQYAPPGDAAALKYLKAFSAIESLPEDASTLTPMLIVRAGREEIPTLNDALDRFVAKALAANAPITVTNYPAGGHGFDSFDTSGDIERSRQIVRSSIEFMRTHLGLG
jgi:acetyl esterase/lipase